MAAEGILGWKVWTCQANQGQGACRGKGLAEESDPLSDLGTHIFLKLGVLSHQMELELCAFQRRVVEGGNAGCSCRVVYLCHHTLHPCKERRSPPGPGNSPLCSGGCTVSARESSTCTTLQAAQLERTSLKLCTDKALFTLLNVLRSLLSRGKWDRKEAEETTHPSASWGQNCPARLTFFLLRNDFEEKSILVVVSLPSCAFSMHTLLQFTVPAIAPCGTQAAGPQGNKKPQTVAVAYCIYLFASIFLEGI